MRSKLKFTISMLAWACVLLAAYSFTAHAQSAAAHTPPVAQQQSGSNNQSATGSAIGGSGTPGHLARWLGVPGSGVLGDSIIFEDKFNKVGIGTITPTSPLTVQGLIETTLGGYKFPDGTVQTTALSAGQVVSSLNGLKDNIQLAAGANLTITSSGNTLTIAAPNVLTRVAHDATLTGDGASTPLGLAVPLIIKEDLPGSFGSLIGATNTFPGGTAITGFGGPADTTNIGGTGVFATGGSGSTNAIGGDGIRSIGGSGSLAAGPGGSMEGGTSDNGAGGAGAVLLGGRSTGTGHTSGAGVVAFAGLAAGGATPGLAGDFRGDVAVSGKLSKGAGSFKIDHPLDPENKYLYHSFVESPDMMNIYNGTITTDGDGNATVTLPDWFEALNQDFRYQLTVIGTFAQAIVAEKVKGNRFTVKTNAPNVEVSWQVTGIRHDAFANKNRIPVEERKSEDERGLYLHPDAFNQPENKGVQFAQVERLNAARERAKSQSQQQ
jgi:hypothetical protein